MANKGRPKTRLSCGVYCFTNLITNKRYIGYAQIIEDRRDVHWVSLRGNYHSNPHFQNAFNKYGEENFYFSILEICNKNELRKKEYEWGMLLQVLDPQFGYNIQPFNKEGEPETMSEETKKKISIANTGKKRNITPEWRKKLSDATKGRKLEPRIFGDKRNTQIINLDTGIIYNSIVEAAEALNICQASIIYRLKHPGRRQVHCKRTNIERYNG